MLTNVHSIISSNFRIERALIFWASTWAPHIDVTADSWEASRDGIDKKAMTDCPADMDVVIGVGTAGTYVVKALLSSGRSVRAVDFEDPRKHAERFGIIPEGVELQLVQGDATDAKSVARFLSGPVDGVILAFQGGGYLSAGKVDHGVRVQPI